MASKVIYVLFTFGLVLATGISMILQILSLEEGEYEKSQFVVPNLAIKDLDPIRIGDDLEHTFVFVQISDIHISLHFDLSRKDDLRQFCTEVIDIIRPKVVIASGDLTDSRSKSPLGSGQFEQEWIWYHDVLESTNVTKKTVWLDLRGNHDNFDIYGWNSSNNYYRIYSNYGKHSERHYHYTIEDVDDKYTFIAVDACVSPSPKRPYNFVGMLDHHDIETIQNMRDAAIRNGTNYTIYFGHYPTSSIVMPSYNLRHILSGPYLAGHFHTLNNMVKEMYATHREGSLELEVGDFKDNRIFRVAAIDHGLFSFTDVKLHEYPIILITNPKNSKFHMPGYEPIHRIRDSTHIRVLVYSISEIISVRARISNSSYVEMERTANKNLFVLRWNPEKFKTGLHRLTVKARDILDNERRVTESFSFDNSKEDFSFGGRVLLRISTRSFGITIYLIGLSICLTPLLVGFYLNGLNKGRMLKAKAKYSSFYKSLFKLYLLGSQRKVSLVLFTIPLYLFIGPWYVGHVLTGHLGVGFVWGIVVDGVILPTALTYVWALIMVVLFHLPITCTIAHIIYCNFMRHEEGLLDKSFFTKYVHLRHFFFIFVVFCNSLISYSFVYAYGPYTVMFGFAISYLLVVYLILFYHVCRLQLHSFPEDIRPRLKKSTLEDSLIEFNQRD